MSSKYIIEIVELNCEMRKINYHNLLNKYIYNL